MTGANVWHLPGVGLAGNWSLEHCSVRSMAPETARDPGYWEWLGRQVGKAAALLISGWLEDPSGLLWFPGYMFLELKILARRWILEWQSPSQILLGDWSGYGAQLWSGVGEERSKEEGTSKVLSLKTCAWVCVVYAILALACEADAAGFSLTHKAAEAQRG